MAVNVNFQDVATRELQKRLVSEAETNGATKLQSFTILPANLSLRCKPMKINGKLRLAVGTFTTSTDRVVQGCYFSGISETDAKRYSNFFVSMSDNELDDITKPENSNLEYQIVTVEYTNSDGLKRTVARFESVYA